jgi:hypothetical protein
LKRVVDARRYLRFEKQYPETTARRKSMKFAHPAAERRIDLVRSVLQAIHLHTHRRIEKLEVDCDGEIVTVRGEAPTYYLWQLAFAAARHASRKVGGLLVDYRVRAVPMSAGD